MKKRMTKYPHVFTVRAYILIAAARRVATCVQCNVQIHYMSSCKIIVSDSLPYERLQNPVTQFQSHPMTFLPYVQGEFCDRTRSLPSPIRIRPLVIRWATRWGEWGLADGRGLFQDGKKKNLESFAAGLHLVSTETPHGAVERAEFRYSVRISLLIVWCNYWWNYITYVIEA